MTTVNMIPPSDGQHNSITVNGRTYSSTPGVAVPVPDFDANVLQANGWTVQTVTVTPSLNPTTVLATSGLVSAYDFQATVNPASPSTAAVPVLEGDAIYASGASSIGGGGHMIGALGRFINQNTVTLPLAVGAEGKIDNTTTGIITTAICVEQNLGSNAGTLTNWFGGFSDIGSNAGTIGIAAMYGCQVDGNTGSIGTLAGFYFPTLNTPGTITGTTYGYFFGNNPGITGTKYAVFVNDPNALIFTQGSIQAVGKTTTSTFQLDTGTKTATAVAGAATLNKASGKITTESLTTAAGAAYTLTLTNSQIAAADTVFASIDNGTNSAGLPIIGRVTPAAGSVTIVVNNIHASAALNGTLVISFASMKA